MESKIDELIKSIDRLNSFSWGRYNKFSRSYWFMDNYLYFA